MQAQLISFVFVVTLFMVYARLIIKLVDRSKEWPMDVTEFVVWLCLSGVCTLLTVGVLLILLDF